MMCIYYCEACVPCVHFLVSSQLGTYHRGDGTWQFVCVFPFIRSIALDTEQTPIDTHDTLHECYARSIILYYLIHAMVDWYKARSKWNDSNDIPIG